MCISTESMYLSYFFIDIGVVLKCTPHNLLEFNGYPLLDVNLFF